MEKDIVALFKWEIKTILLTLDSKEKKV